MTVTETVRATASCAIHYAAEAYESDHPRVVGRQSAGAGFLEALVRSGTQRELYCLTGSQSEFAEFQRKVASLTPEPLPSVWVRPDDLEPLRKAGCLYQPGPIIAEIAWLRRFRDERLFSICGITHSVATDRVIRGIRDFLTAPTQPWDALVCTSKSALAATERIMDSWTDYLVGRGFTVPANPMRTAVIPLGVHLDRFRRDEAAFARGRALRRRLNIPEEAVVGLYFGRFDFLSKAHPTPMYRSFELAQRALPPDRLHLLMTGQFGDPRAAAQFENARNRFGQSINLHMLDGNDGEADASWFAADFFVSLTDNVQESFGLTPVEAMAASLPCIVSDWDGYRETVVDGETGFLIPTLTPPPGAGIEIADHLARRAFDHYTYIGIVSQSTAVDIDACAHAIVRLTNDRELRLRLGESARRRAETVYDWRTIIEQYTDLWSELAELRGAAPVLAKRQASETVHPDYPDPFSMFRAHPTRALGDDDEVALADLDAPFVLERLRKHGLHTFAGNLLLEPPVVDRLLAVLATPRTVRELIGEVGAPRRERLLRTVAWLYKYGIVSVPS
ncbi:MAG TPA: glycosyltransferase family 4 protein [Thermoanaerobaculia bacterium]|nr:glycosyltransferase family 4 protein [Thermoanaerobaculia bacterium]